MSPGEVSLQIVSVNEKELILDEPPKSGISSALLE
jgi:hypothetical protein